MPFESSVIRETIEPIVELYRESVNEGGNVNTAIHHVIAELDTLKTNGTIGTFNVEYVENPSSISVFLMSPNPTEGLVVFVEKFML